MRVIWKMLGVEVKEVTDSIVCVRRRSYLTCSYIVRQPAGLVLVDAGMDSSGSDVRAGLKYLGAKPKDVRAILLTHWHNDHSAGARAAQSLTGAPVYYHRGDRAWFSGKTRSGGVRGWLSDLLPEWGVLVLAKGLLGESTPRPVRAQYLVEDGEIILDDFVAIETPGHTPGHVSYYHAREEALFAGDALAVIRGQLRFMARFVTMNQRDARSSLERCLKLRPRLICPGHREPMKTGVAAECERMLKHLSRDGHWPLLG